LGDRRRGGGDRRVCGPSEDDAHSRQGHISADVGPPLLAPSRRFAAPIAYIGGSLGVLMGADLLNLGRLRSLGAPAASIGGGTSDDIFLIEVIAAVLASPVV
jgi:hypothetical protein